MGDIVDVISSTSYLKMLASAIDAAGLAGTLRETGPFTVFAPTDDAFSRMSKETVNELMEDASKLREVLGCHIVQGEITAAAMSKLKSVKTLQGKEVEVDSSWWHLHRNIKLNGADIVKTDVAADNGLIHMIDKVILPKEFTQATPASYQVKAYMLKEFRTISSEVTVAEAARTMASDESKEGYLIVLRAGRPVGIITESDVVNKVVAKNLDASKTSVAEIMSSPLITVDPDSDLLDAAELMKERNVRRLIVMRDEVVYGILTASDIAQACGQYVDKTVRDIIPWTTHLSVI